MNKTDDQGAVALVDRLLARAVVEQASDVHIEPRADHVRVRYRIDGVMVERQPLGDDLRHSIVSRLKVMARLDIAEKRLPQDGGFSFWSGERSIDVRISTFPTEHGEKVALRLLSRDASSLDYRSLGIGPRLGEELDRIIAGSYGALLVTGPTGSGKTSTLYALLRRIDARRRTVVTLEDPIEYRFEDVIQGQTLPRIGFTFASGLRAILRQDPDVIMVGEMRDPETADIAFKAALTGHLVLSSLHTSSAIETFVRLFDMGLERFVVASSLQAILGQRLVRRLCTRCRCQVTPTEAVRLLTGIDDDEAVIYDPVGCEHCNHTGYLGRMGIYELIHVDDELADLIKSPHTTRAELKGYMETRGLHGLRAAGFRLVDRGITSVEEVLRVT